MNKLQPLNRFDFYKNSDNMLVAKEKKMEIKLDDIFENIDKKNTKIKFNMNAGDVNKRALDLLLSNDEEWMSMNGWKTKHPNNNYGNAKYVLSFAQYYPYGSKYFLFDGLYKIKKIQPEVFDGVGYNLEKVDEYEKYNKRLIIKLERLIGRDTYNRKYENVIETYHPIVYEIAPNTKIGPFNGYQNTSLSHINLQNIINNNEPSWKQALENVKGVYVITDTSNGNLYIGSASGNTDGIWQRWSAYAHLNNLTGGNKKLMEIKKIKGEQYIKENFTYSIIEIFDTKTKEETILSRESYWKKVFKTKNFGYNEN